MSFMLALPKISLHGAGAIGDMVNPWRTSNGEKR